MIVRVVEPGRPGFVLRKGEQGISVFDLDYLDPPLSAEEVLAAFRPVSALVVRSKEEVEAKGLRIVYVLGSDALPLRLREAHAEIQPRGEMTRSGFKQALKELE